MDYNTMQARVAGDVPAAQGRLSARERLCQLLDAGSFVALDAMLSTPGCEALGGGVLAGWGRIDGTTVCVAVQDAAVNNGALTAQQASKIARAMRSALQCGAPFVCVLDSAGLSVMDGARSMEAVGQLMALRAQLSGIVPQINVVLGPCAGTLAMYAAMGDIVIMAKDKSARLASAGTQVLQSAGGASTTVGGAVMNACSTGLATLTAENESEALEAVREVLAYLPANNLADSPVVSTSDSPARTIEELNALSQGAEYGDIREIMATVVDDGLFTECSRRYAPEVITAFARLGGNAVGFVATQSGKGKLTGQACAKAARFVRLCDCFHIPIVNLVDCEGLVVDNGEEEAGLVARAASLAFAYSAASVPKVALVIGKAIGAAYVSLVSRAMGIDTALAWPGAVIAPLMPEGMTAVLGAADIAAAVDPIAAREAYAAEYQITMASPYQAAQDGVLDDVIMPAETRVHLINALAMLADKRLPNMPRVRHNAPLM